MAMGPVLGGTLVELVGWRSIFWVNVPVCAAAIMLTTLFVPESKALAARRADPVGQVLVIVLLASVTSAIIEGIVPLWLLAAAIEGNQMAQTLAVTYTDGTSESLKQSVKCS